MYSDKEHGKMAIIGRIALIFDLTESYHEIKDL